MRLPATRAEALVCREAGVSATAATRGEDRVCDARARRRAFSSAAPAPGSGPSEAAAVAASAAA
eukprot:3157274-Prymnesium_polylepis.1